MEAPEGSVACPRCGSNSLAFDRTEYDVPHFGKVVIVVTECTKCGFRQSEVAPLEPREPRRYRLEVREPIDLYAKVIKSRSSFLRIPELGIEIKPGPASDAYITNVEGVLERVEMAVRASGALESKSEARRRRARELIEKLEAAREGRVKFSITLADPFGSGAIAHEDPSRVKSRRLSRREIDKLLAELGL